MTENSLDSRIQATIENALADSIRMTMEERANLIRQRLQANGLCPTVRRTPEHPMALSPLGEIDYPRFHRLPG